MLPIKYSHTESGRGISGELESIDGLINIGSVEWLKSNGTVFPKDINKGPENDMNKSHTIVGVSINKKLLGIIILGDLGDVVIFHS